MANKWWSNLKYRYKLMVGVFLISLIVSLFLVSNFLELAIFIKNFNNCSNTESGCGVIAYAYTIFFLFWIALSTTTLSIIFLPLAWLYGKYKEGKEKN